MSDVEGVHFVRIARPGKPLRWYVYAWRGEGAPCILKAVGPKRPKLGKPELEALAEARAALNAPRDEGLLSGLVRQWRGIPPSLNMASPEWKALSPTTRKTWGSQLNAIEEKWGSTPLQLWNDPRMVGKVIAWRDGRQKTPRAADLGVQVLGELLAFGKLRARVAINVAADIPGIYAGGNRQEIIWTEEDIAAFTAAAHKLNRPHVVDGLRLAALTGLRREDLVTLKLDQVQQFAIVKKALKRSRRKRRFATMPRIPQLDELLEELKTRPRREGVDTVLVNSFGRPWSGDGFGGSFTRIRDAANGGAGIVHVDPETGERRAKHLHDVRGTFCTRLILAAMAAGAPLTDQEVADLMGWSPEQVAGIRRAYVDQASIVVAIGERIAGGL